MPRIEPLEPPYPDGLSDMLEGMAPPDGMAPMILRAVGTSQRAWDKFIAGSLLDKGPLPMRKRELTIFRTAAQIGADYEWGMHSALYAERCDIDEKQLNALAKSGSDADCWTEAEAALIATADALIDHRHLSDAEFARLAEHYTQDQIFEIVMLVGFYQSVALIIGTFDIPQEKGTPPIPR